MTTTIGGKEAPTFSVLAGHGVEKVNFAIDLVYLWVDDQDPQWIKRRDRRLSELGNDQVKAASAAAHLYRNRDELRYSLRSVEMYAPFIRKIFLVTDDQIPDWLDTSHPQIEMVSHREILRETDLPTFNSNAIDTGLHRIPGLAEHFLVTNDDILFGGPTRPEDFFEPSGTPHVFLSMAHIPLGDPTPGEPAVDSAEKNVRSLILRDSGKLVTQKHKHIPIPQRKSIRLEVEAKFAKEIEKTATHPFRESTDVSFCHLANYYALSAGRATSSTLPYRYINTADWKLGHAVGEALSGMGSSALICLNDADEFVLADRYGEEVATITPDMTSRDSLIQRFFDSAYPNQSHFERRITDDAG